MEVFTVRAEIQQAREVVLKVIGLSLDNIEASDMNVFPILRTYLVCMNTPVEVRVRWRVYVSGQLRIDLALTLLNLLYRRQRWAQP
jgi:hypothetical protein